jgi:pyruvate dehydrogenase E2 component (dihydrolipoamide acetyltransferase)
MATAVIMPKQGLTVETCIITKWFKNKGESVSVGDILFSYETDKAAFDLESPVDGILLDVYFNDGAEVPILTNVAVIGKSGEATDSFNPARSTLSAQITTAVPEPYENSSATQVQDLKTISSAMDFRIRISPRAKRIAREKGLDFNSLQGSGPDGRIIERDIEKALAKVETIVQTVPQDNVEYSDQPLSNVRKIIAKAMHSSLQNSAQLTHHMSADVRHLLEARQRIKNDISSGKSQQDITINDMICWCVIRALERFIYVNSHFLDDRIRTFNKINLGIAVDTSRGLMVPALKNANDMDLIKLSKELKSIADACKRGSITPELIQSTAATFTVSNLGSYGVEMFTPVINLPQTAILGVCTIINRPSIIDNNILGFVPFIGLSLTYDHRAIDGGPATLFLKEIKEQIESFNY